MLAANRTRIRDTVENPRFQQFIIAVIVVNAVTLGCETSGALMARHGDLLHLVDRIALGIFVLELGLRIYAHGWRFFRDPWSVFDLVIIVVAVAPATGEFSVLRTLRILRALRLVSMVPSMRRVVGGLLAALPGMGSIMALLGLIIYVSAVIGTTLYGRIAPDHFGSLATSLFTLFQTMTGEAWPDLAREVMAQEPSAWVFFVVYILISSFMVLNLFIAVTVSAMEGQVMADARAEEAANAAEEQLANREILAELRSLRAELSALRATSDQ